MASDIEKRAIAAHSAGTVAASIVAAIVGGAVWATITTSTLERIAADQEEIKVLISGHRHSDSGDVYVPLGGE